MESKIKPNNNLGSPGTEIKTQSGLEGLVMPTTEVVGCPITGRKMALKWCRQCNYLIEVRVLPRGKDSDRRAGKKVLICAPPLARPIEEVLT